MGLEFLISSNFRWWRTFRKEMALRQSLVRYLATPFRIWHELVLSDAARWLANDINEGLPSPGKETDEYNQDDTQCLGHDLEFHSWPHKYCECCRLLVAAGCPYKNSKPLCK